MKLFISYRSTNSNKVDPIVHRLRSLNYEVWQDKDSIPAGQDWWEAICEGIQACDVFIFMVSSESVKSFACLAELSFAHELNLPIIPFVIEGEWIYNAGGKHDVDFWDDIPEELEEERTQFLFYEGANFVDKLKMGIDTLMAKNMPRLPASPPPDPRQATDASNNVTVIYDEAYDFAYRGELKTAKKLFRKLVKHNDPIFGAISLEWVHVIDEYARIRDMAGRISTRKIAQGQWSSYTQKFPNDFMDGIFDPNNVAAQLANKTTQKPVSQTPKTQTPPRKSVGAGPALPEKPPQTPLQLAQNFKGKKNSDWTPIIETFEVKGIPFEMCLVPVGSFMMGSEDYDDEKPVHQQTITKPYWIGLHPVTNSQWRMAVENSGGTIKEPEGADWYKDKSKANHPVVGVTWYQCRDFMNWLGSEWSLPTELQWEYAARGVENLVYPFGNDFQPALVVYSKNSNKSTAAIAGRPKGASWVGAQDMSGNVWEWMSSLYKDYPYQAEDGRENISSDSGRVLRGGSWRYISYVARAVARSGGYPDRRNLIFGFRMCVPLL